jgi:hypothetical protein
MRIKQLPPNPNLEHLKRQAKDLLVAMRETEPSTALADAQRALAAEYQFRTWSDLKAEVERRRTDVEPFDSDVVAEVAAAFGLGAPLGDAQVVAYDFQGPRVRFSTGSGDWMAHAVFDWVDDAQVERTIPLVEAARDLGVSTPRAVPTSSGGWVAKVDVRSWRLDHWMDVGPPLPKPAARASIRRFGELLGALHSLALPADGDRNPWLVTRRPVSEWEEALALAASAGASWAPLLHDALPAIAELTELAPTPPEGPLLLCSHLGGESLRSGPEGTLAVLGWDFAGANLATAELASAANEWANDQTHRIDPRRVESLVAGYRFTAGHVPDLDLAMFSATISAWLNQLASRIGAASWSDDPGERNRAAAEAEHLLTTPLSRARVETLLDAMASAPA